jgi:dihydroneopterin aldolase
MDHIHIDNLRFRAKHGVYANERSTEQEFTVSVRLGVEVPQAGKSDELADTVNYQVVKDCIQEVIEGNSRYLIEKLAEEMAEKILEDKRIKTVELTICKPEVWENGTPGITILRANA